MTKTNSKTNNDKVMHSSATLDSAIGDSIEESIDNSINTISRESAKSEEYKAPFKMVFYSNLPIGRYKKNVLVHFKNLIRSKGYTFKVDDFKREIYAPEIAELLKDRFVPGVQVSSHRKISDITDALKDLELVNSKEETEQLLDLINNQNYKLLGYFKSGEEKVPINLIFERHGSNYTILDYGKVSKKLLSNYI